jgi:GDP-mannose 6-dehydrogenase
VHSALEIVQKTGRSRIGVFGLSFKPGTDDLRESPMVEFVERLIGKGYQIRIFDSEVSLSRIHGANKRYLDKTIPHITSLMDDSPERVARESEVLILGRSDAVPAHHSANLANKVVVDLVRAMDPSSLGSGTEYHGIAW